MAICSLACIVEGRSCMMSIYYLKLLASVFVHTYMRFIYILYNISIYDLVS